MNDLGMFYGFQAQSSDYSWEYDSQGIYKDAARTISADSNNLQRNTTYYLRLRAKNIGGVSWKKNVLNLATSNPKDRSSVMRDSSWPSGNRPTTLKEGSVDPGKIGTLEFSIKTPLEPGTYNEYFLPVADGIAWLEDVGQYWSLVVK